MAVCVLACVCLRGGWAVQGQVVLTDTTAGFRCSPRSHLVFEDALRYLGVKPSGRPDDWAKLRDDHYPVLRKVSLLLWLCIQLHDDNTASARLTFPCVNKKNSLATIATTVHWKPFVC
jgi:hypothetical protein